MEKVAPATLESANAMALLRTLGITLQEIGPTYAVVDVTVSKSHGNYFGGAHGGLIATLIDTVSFFPEPLLPAGRSCTTTNLNVSYVRPAVVGDVLVARSELVHIGRRMASVSVTVKNQLHKLVAHGTVSVMLT